MNNDSGLTFSQSLICCIADTTPSVVSRLISQKGFSHVVKHGEKRKRYDWVTTRAILRDLVTSKLQVKDKIQVFFNFKGGTGKTSMCYQISTMFAILGFNVLAIDCDPQAHLSYSLGFNEGDNNPTLYDVIVNKISVDDIIHKEIYHGLDVIPSNLSLTRLETALNPMPNRERVLSKLLERVATNYDFIFVDTNPTISILNRNATLAADILNIVCETQPYSLKGMEMLVNEINHFSSAMDQVVRYQIIPNKYESKTATSQEALGILRHEYKDHVIQSIVRKCEDINISARIRKPLFSFCSKQSIALEDIRDLVKALISRSTVDLKHNNMKVRNAT